jgi:hypothetical protein
MRNERVAGGRAGLQQLSPTAYVAVGPSLPWGETRRTRFPRTFRSSVTRSWRRIWPRSPRESAAIHQRVDRRAGKRAIELGFQLVRVLSQQAQDKLGPWLRMSQLPQRRFDERGPALEVRARPALMLLALAPCPPSARTYPRIVDDRWAYIRSRFQASFWRAWQRMG